MFGLLFALAASAHQSKYHKSIVHRHRGSYFGGSGRSFDTNSQTGTVTADVLNVRASPSTSAKIVGKLYSGNTVTIVSSSGVWKQIRCNGISGWCHGDYIRIGGSTGSGKRMTGFYTTGYYPDNSPMEGGYLDCLGNKLRTLQQFRAGSATYVSIAVDRSVIPMKSIVNIDGYPGVKFWACDVGGAIKGKHIDICCANAKETYKVTKNGVGITVYGTSPRP